MYQVVSYSVLSLSPLFICDLYVFLFWDIVPGICSNYLSLLAIRGKNRFNNKHYTIARMQFIYQIETYVMCNVWGDICMLPWQQGKQYVLTLFCRFTSVYTSPNMCVYMFTTLLCENSIKIVLKYFKNRDLTYKSVIHFLHRMSLVLML